MPLVVSSLFFLFFFSRFFSLFLLFSVARENTSLVVRLFASNPFECIARGPRASKSLFTSLHEGLLCRREFRVPLRSTNVSRAICYPIHAGAINYIDLYRLRS